MDQFDIRVDPSTLSALYEDIGREGFSELADVVRNDLRDIGARLDAAVAAQDATDLRRALHKLAGILMQYGFGGIAARALHAEQSDDPAALAAEAAAFSAIVPQALAAFNAATDALMKP